MNTLISKLEEMLEQKGWSVTARDEGNEWWADERWQVQSRSCGTLVNFAMR